MMYVPKGFAHGFQALTDGATVFYMVSAFYAPQSEGGLRFDDPRLAIEWPRAVHRYFGQGRPMAAAAPLILMTGATGFVGRQVLRELANATAGVRVVIRAGTQDRLAQSDAIETVVTNRGHLWPKTRVGGPKSAAASIP